MRKLNNQLCDSIVLMWSVEKDFCVIIELLN